MKKTFMLVLILSVLFCAAAFAEDYDVCDEDSLPVERGDVLESGDTITVSRDKVLFVLGANGNAKLSIGDTYEIACDSKVSYVRIEKSADVIKLVRVSDKEKCKHDSSTRNYIGSDTKYHYYEDVCDSCACVKKSGKARHKFVEGFCEDCGECEPAYDHKSHWIREWYSLGGDKHIGFCTNDYCQFFMDEACEYATLEDDDGDEITVCPLCGAICGNEKKYMKTVTIFSDDVDNNDITVRTYGDYMTVCEDYCGKLQPLHEMRIKLSSKYKDYVFTMNGEELTTEIEGKYVYLTVVPEEDATIAVIEIK